MTMYEANHPYYFFEFALPKNELHIGGHVFSILNWGKVEPAVWNNNRHCHSFYEACFSYSGNGTCLTNGKTIGVDKGQWLLIPPGKSHKIFSATDSLWGIFCMYFSLIPQKDKERKKTEDRYLLRDITNLKEGVFTASDRTRPICQMISEEITTQRDDFEIYFGKMASLIFLDLLRCIKNTENMPTAPFAYHGNSEEVRLQKIIKFIESNIENELSIKEIADSVFISERQLSRIFHKAFSESPLQVVNRIKINMSIQLLSGTELSIKEISQKCGFNSECYFMTTFKKNVGITAGEFRKKSIFSRDFTCGYKPLIYNHDHISQTNTQENS